MIRDRLDLLLQLAFLEGVITTHGLYEIVAGKRKPRVKASEAAKEVLEQRLEQVLVRRTKEQERPITVGAFLSSLRADSRLQPREVASRLGVSLNVYKMLERDRVSPLKISVEGWKKFRMLFRLPTDELIAMIRRTHRLALFRPSFQMTLARYDKAKNVSMKRTDLRRAAEELYARADLVIPQSEQRKLDALFAGLREE